MDFTLRLDGSIGLLTPTTDAAREWVDAHIGGENSFQPYWPIVAVEARFMPDVLTGIRAAGLVVREG